MLDTRIPVALPDALQIHASDSVAVALRDLGAGEAVWVNGASVAVKAAIAKGHKFALAAHAAGTPVIKYGLTIGRTTQAIAAGEHVHVHNLATALAGEVAYAPPASSAKARVQHATGSGVMWQGYLRADGRAATRNEIWILPTVGCVGLTSEQIARAAEARHAGLIAQGRIDGILAFAHPHGCSQLGDDLGGTRALLAGLAANPNAAGVLLLGLGCESNQLADLLAAIPASLHHKIRMLSSQSAGDELAKAAVLVDELVAQAATAQREPLPLAALTVGLKCGGSDGFSGLTANPLLGRFSDALAAAGGTPVLTEIPEIFGAEQALLERAVDAATFDAAAALVNGFKRYYLDQGLSVSENPSPGNIAGGITTLEEKSAGAVQKAGNAPLCSVVPYGEQARGPGLALLEAPGNDAVSSTALTAAGATLVLFTTGRGTPLGFPAPTVKVASNRTLAQAKPHWIDFDASRVLDEGLEAADAAFLNTLMAIASGQKTAAERTGQRAIAIWKKGVTL
ncbi:MAG: altronate hydrolase [Novosphingobium sp. 28-62-57]|uniref:UxaA family hydrolase n=1 Tax=unclassified Novosphingobium TaxID=2644732 RepID=UPI000BC431B8|nr:MULTISPECIES: altronate dehydratase family protein [unclassified Novosphingobium]OYW51375.1 MAG: altronate hydrolase [Novosphingobium sp. 12-62-10]OYZ10489.1 MAG: altronate hydrolase [Novosphingobium sp. 28-62-57]OZA40630.1 MAG: altronate hydrolase [Novosphingobium sp. 17-62-9]HQS68113.1 altronate dehydratase family protein [Novosphingobium sp.]